VQMWEATYSVFGQNFLWHALLDLNFTV
jgi:hypothetical protein